MVRQVSEARRPTVVTKSQLRESLPAIQSYGLAVLSVCVALGIGLLASSYGFRGVELPLYLLATAITAWYAGSGPSAVAVLLSILSFDYCFVEPRYSFYFTVSEIPYLIVCTAFASLVAWLISVGRRVEARLRQARDRLEIEVQERTRQTNLLNLTLNLTHDAILVRDMDAVITHWNRGAEEMYGWTSQEAIGKRSHELFRTVFPAPLVDIEVELLRTGRWEGELKHTKPDGSRLVVLSRWSLRRSEGGGPAAILETNNDITDRKRREEDIGALNDELGRRTVDLEATNQELEAFAYSISHDLRAPLRHMVGFTELLQKNAASVLDDRSRRYVTMILESASRMGNLIDDLLAFSRIGRIETHKTMVSLQQLVQEALSEVAQDTQGRNIIWQVGTLPAWYGDRSMLRLALVNLVSNAVKFTRTRTKAEIEIACQNEERDRVVVFIRDNGVGFDMKYVGKLFGVFQRLHASETFEGTGIGLATVQRIVHRHGGRIWAEGVVDQGATFYFSLSKSQGV
jgi:PAS domain S-box-containing protein